MSPTNRRRLLVFLRLAVLLQVVIPLALWFGRRFVLFHPFDADPPQRRLAALRPSIEGVERFVQRPDGVRLAALDLAPAAGVADGATVLFLHGNGGNVMHRLDFARRIVDELQVRVLLLDYAGYGRSEGSPSETGVVEDALAAYDWLIDDGVEPQRLYLFGESLGGAVAAELAARRPVAGVAVQSTFSSLESMARRRFGWLPLLPWLAGDALRTRDALERSGHGPLVIHGTRDRVVPFDESEALAALPGARRVSVHAAGHNDLWRIADDTVFGALHHHLHQSVGRP